MNIEPLEARIAPATFIVTALTDVVADDGELTLREAVTAANNTPAADTIKFDPVLAGTITLTLGTFNITETLTIVGGGKITLSGNDTFRIISVNNADTVKDHPLTVSGLRFVGGNAGANGDGGAIISSEGLRILNCTFADNSAGGEGGAVRVVTPTGFVVVKDSHFSDNTSGDGAGGLQAGSAKGITLTGSVFAGNVGGFAGGASLGVESENGKITVSGCTFVLNDSTGAGGGLTVGGPKVAITNSTFTDNTADLHGGGLTIAGGAYSLAGLKFLGNSAPTGGAISSTAGAKSITLAKSVLEGNAATAGGGGGIYLTGVVDGFVATISATQIIGNTATGGSGGGILALDTGGKITIKGSLISGNTTASQGGGIAIHQNDPADPVIATLTGNTISGNDADSAGGLSLFRHGDFILSKNVIAGNRADGTGGLDFDLSGDLTMKSNQVVGNRSVNRTGGMNLVTGGTNAFTNSGNVIAHNEGGETGGLSISGSNVNVTIAKNTKITGNIAGSGTMGGGLTIENGVGTVLAPVVGNYNRVNSAFNQIAGTLTGAPIPPPSVAANIIVTNLNDSGAGSLREAIAQANATPAADKIKFDPALDGLITLATPLVVTETLTILGNGRIAISGNDTTRIFEVDHPDTTKDHPLTLNGLTLANGKVTGIANSGGAIRSTEGLTLIGCILVDNEGGGTGGAIALTSTTGVLTVKDSHFADNIAVFAGGAVTATVAKAITISGSVFQENVASTGGGIVLRLSSATGKLTMTSSYFVGNQAASGVGGGTLIDGTLDGTKFTKVAVSNTTFAGNSATGNGGGLHLEDGAFKFSNVSLLGNTAGQSGGGLATSDGLRQLAVTKSLIAVNTAASAIGGGGVYLVQGEPGFAATFSATSFLGNRATDSNATGGGLFANSTGGKLTVKASLFAGNEAVTRGGGLAVQGTGSTATSVALTGNVIAGNGAGFGAGLSLTAEGPLALAKNSIIANHATILGGGGDLTSAVSIKLSANSIVGNRADGGVGGLNLSGPAAATLTISGDLIAFNEGTIAGGLRIGNEIAGIIAKNTRITGNIGEGASASGGVTQSSLGAVKLLAKVLGNLNRTAPANNETFGLFA